MKVFISSPLRGETPEAVRANRAKAARHCRRAYDAGYVPLAPHVYLPNFLDVGDPPQERFAERFGKMWIRDADAVWAFDADGISAGMRAEIGYADLCGVPVLYESRNEIPSGAVLDA